MSAKRRICGGGGFGYGNPHVPTTSYFGCIYIDPNPISSLDNQGHNYFLSHNPYTLNSYAAFGETNYNIASDLGLTAGLRWTDDRKHFIDIPSELITTVMGILQSASSISNGISALAVRRQLDAEARFH